MKKYIFIALGIILFAIGFYITRSWIYGISFVLVVTFYVTWLLGVELGLFSLKENKTKEIKRDESAKDNPTIW